MPSACASDTIASENGSSPSALAKATGSARARQIDRGVEGVAGTRQREAAVAAAGEFDDRLADADRAFGLLAHGDLPITGPCERHRG